MVACKASSNALGYGWMRRMMMSDQKSKTRSIGWKRTRRRWRPSGAAVSGRIFSSKSLTMDRFLNDG